MAASKKKQTLIEQKQQLRDQLFLDLIALLPFKKAALKHLANEADVSYQTLWNWLYGATVAPRISTMIKVANALGYSIVLKRTKSTRKLKIVD